MSIEVKEVKRVFRYNSITLPDIPGMEPREVRDVYSAQYPELVSAEIEDGGIKDGVHEFTFRKAVGTKGADERMAALRASIDAEAQGRLAADRDGKLIRALGHTSAKRLGLTWRAFVRNNYPTEMKDHPDERVMPKADMLAPVV